VAFGGLVLRAKMEKKAAGQRLEQQRLLLAVQLLLGASQRMFGCAMQATFGGSCGLGERGSRRIAHAAPTGGWDSAFAPSTLIKPKAAF
jgi:hypothetical protein